MVLRFSLGASLALGEMRTEQVQAPSMDITSLFPMWTDCPKINCKNGKVHVQEKVEKARPHYYGCDETKYNMFLGMIAGGSANVGGRPDHARTLMTCCTNRDICMQSCGMTKEECEDDYLACVERKCKDDKNCVAGGRSGVDSFAAVKPEKKKESKCWEYIKTQKKHCKCVPEDQYENELASRLKGFYEAFDPETLKELPTNEGDDVFLNATAHKKHAGEEPHFWFKLMKKYSHKYEKRVQKDRPQAPIDLDAMSERHKKFQDGEGSEAFKTIEIDENGEVVGGTGAEQMGSPESYPEDDEDTAPRNDEL